MSDDDKFLTFTQRLPIEIYEQWKVQLKRVAEANGWTAESWDLDDKTAEGRGVRVRTLEALTRLLARSDNEVLEV